MRNVKSRLSPHDIEIRAKLHPVLLVIYSEDVRDVNSDVDHVDPLLHW